MGRYVLGERAAAWMRDRLAEGEPITDAPISGAASGRQKQWVKPIAELAPGLYAGRIGIRTGDGLYSDIGPCRIQEGNAGSFTIDKWVEGSRTGDHTDGTPQFAATGFAPTAGMIFQFLNVEAGGWSGALQSLAVPAGFTISGLAWLVVPIATAIPIGGTSILINAVINPFFNAPTVLNPDAGYTVVTQSPAGSLVTLPCPFSVWNNTSTTKLLEFKRNDGGPFHSGHSIYRLRQGNWQFANP